MNRIERAAANWLTAHSGGGRGSVRVVARSRYDDRNANGYDRNANYDRKANDSDRKSDNNGDRNNAPMTSANVAEYDSGNYANNGCANANPEGKTKGNANVVEYANASYANGGGGANNSDRKTDGDNRNNANANANDTTNAKAESAANGIKRKSLKSFISSNKEEILQTLNDVMNVSFKGLENPSLYDTAINRLAELPRRPLARQSRLIAAAYQRLLEKPSLLLSAEMGTGKTQMGISLIHLLNSKRVGIICPPHLVSKWALEIETILGKGDKAVRPYKIVTIGCGEWISLDYYRNMKVKRGESLIFIFSYSAAKLGYRLRKTIVRKKAIRIVEETTPDGYKVQRRVVCDLLVCPDCGKNVFGDENDEVGSIDDVKRRCPNCDTILRQPDKGETRLSLAEYAARRLPRGWFDLLIADEIHEMKGGDTGQGNALGAFASRSKKVVGLTGTLLNGYAESVFYILYRLNPKLMKDRLGLEYREVERFIDLYGARETRWKVKDIDVSSEGVIVKKSGTPMVRNIPKVNPLLLTQLLGTSIFLRLDEMNIALPRYSEIVERVEPDEAVTQEYTDYLDKLIDLVRERSAIGMKKLGELATASLAILGVPNKPRGDNLAYYSPPVARNEAEQAITGASELLPITNKEKRLVEIVREELALGRKCLVYITFTRLGTTEGVLNALKEAMPNKVIRVLPDSVDSKKRESWLRANPCDILITNPEKVKTGLDLLEYPTILFFQPTYKVYSLKQAARRSWRIGQRQDVKVYFLVYQKTPEEKALQLIARKLSAAGLIEGRIGDGGLADQADDENIAIALAKSLIKREAVEDFNMEEIALGLRENDPFEDYYLNVCEEIDRARSEKEAKAQAQAVAKDDNALDGSLIVNTINAKAKAESAKTINAEAKAESASAINVIGRAESVKALQSIVSSESTPSLFDDVLNAPLTSVVQALKESAVKEEEEPEAIANVAEAEANANDKANANAGNEANADNRLTIYRIVKSGGGKRVEQKLNLTASELEEITADDSQASFFQRSLFDF